MIAARFEGLFAGRLAGVPGNADQEWHGSCREAGGDPGPDWSRYIQACTGRAIRRLAAVPAPSLSRTVSSLSSG